jgi:hypothetical protein
MHRVSIILAHLSDPVPCVLKTAKLIELLFQDQTMWAQTKALILDSGQHYPTKVVSNDTLAG